jgi:acetyl esterase/lipase
MVRAYIQKAVSAALEWLGRLLVFNRFPPTVGDYARDIPYDCRDRRKQSLDIAVPEGTGPFPVLVYIHGGGFHFMDKKSYTRVAKSFAHGGYIVFNINYRLAPKTVFPEQLQDVAKAIRWAYDNAESYGGDPGCRACRGRRHHGAHSARKTEGLAALLRRV